MKWVFAFNQHCENWYLDLIKVAVVTAKQNTTLQPFCLYDGDETPFTQWLRNQGVELVFGRSVYYSRLEELAVRKGIPGILTIGSGTFLRLELPRIAREKGWTDEFVFYTDCDVMFLRDPVPLLEPLKPRFFAAAPEAWQHRKLHMNAGVMWINLEGMHREIHRLQEFTFQNFEHIVELSWDQGALRVYFNPLHRLAWKLKIKDQFFYAIMTRLAFKTWGWDDLPATLNWKPYWGENERATILHFHALKPHQAFQSDLVAGNIYNTPAYQTYSAQWKVKLDKTTRVE